MLVLGFGVTEENFEKSEEAFIKAGVRAIVKDSGAVYFDEALVEKIKRWVENRAFEWQEKGEGYKNSETHPDRYTYYWVSTLSNTRHLVFIISYHHINRRHAMSPDGWALLANKRIIHMEFTGD